MLTHYMGARKETRLIAIMVPCGAVMKCQIMIPLTLPPGPELAVSTSTKLSTVVSGALETARTVMFFHVRWVFDWLNELISEFVSRGLMVIADVPEVAKSTYCAVSCPISDRVEASPSRKA